MLHTWVTTFPSHLPSKFSESFDDFVLNLLRFNQGEGQEENAIITSTGQYIVAWDFKKVKKGYLEQYEIKKYEDQVVQDNFKFGDDKEIVRNILALIMSLLILPCF